MKKHHTVKEEDHSSGKAMKYTLITIIPIILANEYHWSFLILLIGSFYLIYLGERND